MEIYLKSMTRCALPWKLLLVTAQRWGKSWTLVGGRKQDAVSRRADKLSKILINIFN